MRLALATTLFDLVSPAASLPRHLLERLVEADARHREARRFEDLPEERLRDMGLTRPAGLRRPEPREPWS